MYPSLSYLTEDLFGVKINFPIQTFAVFVTIAFFIAAFVLAKELKRKEKLGLMYLVFNRKGSAIKPHQQVKIIIIIAFISGLIGAKTFSVFMFYNEFTESPINFIFSVERFAFYGGLILGTLSVIYYAKKVYLKIIHLLDAAAPALMIAYSIGRLGGHLSGNGSWGKINLFQKPLLLKSFPNWIWSYRYPNNMINEGIAINKCFGKYCNILQYPVFPTAFYEFIFCFILFIILWKIRKKIIISGVLFAYYLFFLASERLLIEQIKDGPQLKIVNFQLTQPEIVSYILILFSFILFYFARKNKLNW